MLYDPKWEKKTKADPLQLGTLVSWLERQPADEAYDYGCIGHCLLAQYFSEHGFKNINVNSTGFSHLGGVQKLPEHFDEVALGMQAIGTRRPTGFTFGEALVRARFAAANH